MELPSAWLQLSVFVLSSLPLTAASSQVGWLWRAALPATQAESDHPHRDVANPTAAANRAPNADSEAGAHTAVDAGAAETSTASETKPSDAERITRLRRSIDADEAMVRDLRTSLENPRSDYRQAEAEFQRLDEALDPARNSGTSASNASSKGESSPEGGAEPLADLRRRWEMAKERFDVAIEQRKTIQEKILTVMNFANFG